MSEVEIAVNGRAYKIACDSGQEGRIELLASYFDGKVADLARDLGQVGDTRLMLLASLTVCDELFECRRRIADFERAAETLPPETAGAAVRAVSSATDRIAAIAAKAARG